MRTEPVTTPKRKATELLDRLDEDRPRRVEILEGTARGERAVDESRVVSHAKARARMARWLK